MAGDATADPSALRLAGKVAGDRESAATDREGHLR